MIELALLRHGVTDWNQAQRLQGRADTELAPAGRQALAGKRLPERFADAPVYCSPLRRARQTAALLGIERPRLEPALIEMDWGGYEGWTVGELRTRLGPQMQADERRGLDFRPPGGESPRDVQMRLGAWLRQLAAASSGSTAAVAITHKGVIRCLLALAYDWDMTGRQPVKLDWTALHVVVLGPDGGLRPGPVNLTLEDA